MKRSQGLCRTISCHRWRQQVKQETHLWRGLWTTAAWSRAADGADKTDAVQTDDVVNQSTGVEVILTKCCSVTTCLRLWVKSHCHLLPQRQNMPPETKKQSREERKEESYKRLKRTSQFFSLFFFLFSFLFHNPSTTGWPHWAGRIAHSQLLYIYILKKKKKKELTDLFFSVFVGLFFFLFFSLDQNPSTSVKHSWTALT